MQSLSFVFPPAKFGLDPVNDKFEFVEHKVVFEPQDPDVFAIEKKSTSLSLLILERVSVAFAVKFDREVFVRAVEIKDVRPDAVLPSKLSSVDL